MPRVSVVLPARNAEDTLQRAAQSCLGQSYSDLELIIVDDGSTDRTTSIASDLEKSDCRVSFVRFDVSVGVSGAIEKGRQLASGSLIARMDADDVSHPERIEKQVKLLDSDPTLAGCGTSVRLVGAPAADPGRGLSEHVRWLNGLNESDQLAAERFIDSPIANPTSVVRASVLDSLGGYFDPDWAEDYDLWLRFLEAGEKLLNLPQILFDWHDSKTRLTRSSERYSPERFSQAKAHYIARLPLALERRVEIAGAGPIGKRLARDLASEGVSVHRFYEVNPRRLGEKIGGVKVVDYSLLKSGSALLISAVGLPGARARIRELAIGSGFREGSDFFCAA